VKEYFEIGALFAVITWESDLLESTHSVIYLQDKSMKSRRGALDRCSDTAINNKKHSSELCYADTIAVPRSTNSPGFHRKGIHFGHQTEKGITLICCFF
jgi:hypothetical protein